MADIKLLLRSVRPQVLGCGCCRFHGEMSQLATAHEKHPENARNRQPEVCLEHKPCNHEMSWTFLLISVRGISHCKEQRRKGSWLRQRDLDKAQLSCHFLMWTQCKMTCSNAESSMLCVRHTSRQTCCTKVPKSIQGPMSMLRRTQGKSQPKMPGAFERAVGYLHTRQSQKMWRGRSFPQMMMVKRGLG